MPVSLSGRKFTKLLDFTPDEIRYLIKLSKEFKNLKLTGTPHRYLEGKNIVLLFEKTSTRTRCAFEVAGMDLGMGVTYLDPGSSQMGKKESIEDTARVLGRMYDGIEYRGFAQEIVEDLAANAGVPVWNGLTTEFHPTQMIADMLTVEENFPQGLKGLKFVFMGDAQNNVANSLMVVCAKLGLDFVACGPQEQMPKAELVEQCKEIAAENGGSVTLTEDVDAAATGAHVIYTDIWVHGRARRHLGVPHQAPRALPRDQGRHGQGRRRRHLHALPALLPRHEDHHRRRHRREVRRVRDGGLRRGLRVRAVQGFRRGREPHAHHQGRHVRHP